MGLGSGIRDPENTYSRSQIQGSKRHRIGDYGITAISQWFYLNEVVSKYAKSILAYTENKLKEYKRIRRIVRTPRVFCVYKEYADRHKTEDISTNY
jgi:hypothetical protein